VPLKAEISPVSICFEVFHFECSRDGYTAADTARHRAIIGVKAQHALGSLAFGRIDFQVVTHMNAPENQHLAVQLNFARRFRREPTFASRNPARFQRAAECPGESTGGGSYDIIERGGMRLGDIGADAIVLGDFGMDAEANWLCLHGQIRATQRPFDSLNAHIGLVHHLTRHIRCLQQVARLAPKMMWDTCIESEAG